jgi:hypothetical protein
MHVCLMATLIKTCGQHKSPLGRIIMWGAKEYRLTPSCSLAGLYSLRVRSDAADEPIIHPACPKLYSRKHLLKYGGKSSSRTPTWSN